MPKAKPISYDGTIWPSQRALRDHLGIKCQGYISLALNGPGLLYGKPIAYADAPPPRPHVRTIRGVSVVKEAWL